MNTILICKDARHAGQIQVQLTLHNNQNVQWYRTVKRFIGVIAGYDIGIEPRDYELFKMGSPKIDTIYVVDKNDESKLKRYGLAKIVVLSIQEQFAPKTKTDRALMLFITKIYNKFMAYASDYGISRFYETMLSFFILIGLHIANFIGKPIAITRLLSERIGHLCYNTYAMMKEVKHHRVIALHGTVASPQILKMWSRLFWKTTDSKFIARILEVPMIRKSKYYKDCVGSGDVLKPLHRIDLTGSVPMQFTDDEERRGIKFLHAHGLRSDNYVCIYARDKAYLNAVTKGVDWSYHDFRDVDIKTYRKAVEYLTSQGIRAVRVGMIQHDDPAAFTGLDVFNYVNGEDFYQIFLIAHCKFFLCTSGGLTGVANIFHTPMAVCNWVHLELSTCFRKGDIYIPKKLWHNESGRYLGLSEILSSGIGRFTRLEQYKNAGLDIIDNTEDEILALVKDTLFPMDTEIEPLLSKYKKIVSGDYLCKDTPVIPALTWLRANRNWVE